MKMKWKAIALVATICMSMTATGCGEKLIEIDPFDEQYLTYQFSGISGYTGRIDLDQSKAPNGLTTMYNYECDSPLSNGDIIKLTVHPSEKWLTEAGYKVNITEKEVTVEGLEEIPDELPEDAANSIIDALKEYALTDCQDAFPVVGTEYDYSAWKIQSVGELQLIRGLYEVTTNKTSDDSPFANSDESNESLSYLDQPTATFKALFAIPYTCECVSEPMYGDSQVGDLAEKQNYVYVTISGFSLLDGQVHYNDMYEPFTDYSDTTYSSAEAEDFDHYFDSLSDKQHIASVEY